LETCDILARLRMRD